MTLATTVWPCMSMPGRAAADQIDALDVAGGDARQDRLQGIGLRCRPLAVDQHVAGRAGEAARRADVGEGEARAAGRSCHRRCSAAARRRTRRHSSVCRLRRGSAKADVATDARRKPLRRISDLHRTHVPQRYCSLRRWRTALLDQQCARKCMAPVRNCWIRYSRIWFNFPMRERVNQAMTHERRSTSPICACGSKASCRPSAIAIS